ncbi:MAG: flippase-like domain-containing protein [Methanomicrobiales archaeon]|nr:flippase-like domain-containing protein [Methanomicrobiales archaeon]
MKLKDFLYYFLFAVGIVLILYLIISSKILENLDIFREVNYALLTLAFILTNLNVIVKIYRWQYISQLYECEIPFTESTKIVVGSFFVSGATPAKVGEIVKAYLMKKRHNLSLINGVSGILYERVFEIAILFLVSMGIFSLGLQEKNLIILQLTLALLVIFLIAYFFADQVAGLARNLINKTKIATIDSANLQFRKLAPKHALIIFLISAAAWILEFLRLWVVVKAFGFDLSLFQVSVFFSLAVLIGFLSQIPIGIGVFEGSLAFFLKEAGIPSYYAFGIALVDRVISMYYVMIIGLIYYKWALRSIMDESP